MRKLLWFTIGFTLACVAGVYFLSGNWLLLLGAICLVGGIVLLCLKHKSTKIVAMILIGCLCGFLWNWGFDNLYLSDARNYDAKTVQTQIEVTDYSYTTDYGIASEGKMTLAGKSYRIQFYLNEQAQLKPGDRVTGTFRLRYTADGGEKSPTYHQGKGIFLLGYGRGSVQTTIVEQVPGKYFAAVARDKILTHLDNLFPEDTLGFARALLLGDSSKLPFEQDAAFRTSGIRHVIAVSGLHVSILFAVIYLFGGRNRVVGALLGIPVLVIFAAIAGFTPSIVRACIMQGLMTLSLLVDKEYDPLTALAFAVLVLLGVNPLTITSVSFQLSVGCMVGILLFCKPIQEYLLARKLFQIQKGNKFRTKIIHWFVGSVSVTLSAMITTTPLCAYYFDAVSLVGIVCNLLTLWIVSFVFYGIMIACVAGAIWMPLGKAVAWIVSFGIRYVSVVAKLCSKLPVAAVYTHSVYIVAWLLFAYVLLIIFFCSKKKQPGWLAGCIAVALCVAVLASYIEPRLDSFRFTVLDVGQGQCLLLQKGKQTYVIDCGSDRPKEAADEAANMLLSQGITRIDGLILTHYDGDHAAGAEYLLCRIPADKLYLPVTDDSTNMQLFADRYGDRIQWIWGDHRIVEEGVQIDLYPAGQAISDNESSMCVLCQVDNCDILITGDRAMSGERKLLESHELPDIEVLVAGHHGAKSATGMDLLQAVKPEAVVISVGAENNYGHPSRETLDRLTLFGCFIYRTDLMGTVIFKG